MIISESAIDSTIKVQLSIIIPVYNQEKKVLDSLSRIKKVLDSTLLNYEIVLVDDGSTDSTLDVMKTISEARVRVVSYVPNRGKGYAVKVGILGSKGSAVVFTDGDLDISPEGIKDYVKELGDCDLVIASKRHPMSRVTAPALRKFLSRGFNVIVQLFTGIRLRDTQSGLKAGNGDALRLIFSVMQVKRYAFDVELLSIATLLQLKIREMPIEMALDRQFKFRDMTRMLADVLGISYRLRVKHSYQNQLRELK